MSLGTKNRQKQTADICKQHLREKYPDKLGSVEEFIVEIEGPPKNCDVNRWGQFTDIKGIKKEMFHRLEIRFRELAQLVKSPVSFGGFPCVGRTDEQLGFKLNYSVESRMKLGG